MNSAPNPEYPDWRHAAEARRLEIQGRLVTEALGGKLLLCPLDLSQPTLRILDSATANGHFLYSLRQELSHPDTATLVGTDISPFVDTLGLPANITLQKQDILQPWPATWTGTFDLVHQRNALSVAGTFDRAVDAVCAMIALAKPGGWVQLVDGSMQDGPIESADAPATKLFKVMRQGLSRLGLDTTLGASASHIMEKAGQGLLHNCGSKTGVSPLGKGAATRELEELGYEQLEGLHKSAVAVLQKLPEVDRPMPLADLEGLLPDILAQARQEGNVGLTWYAAWGQRI
ncbi:hypothetical protein GQ53DRAFT_866982 [Thozetella sp. PMI_491]|nr:hypothetical protein GQ53DRAFT_866982 [Thozetella sp. PMI_491]